MTGVSNVVWAGAAFAAVAQTAVSAAAAQTASMTELAAGVLHTPDTADTITVVPAADALVAAAQAIAHHAVQNRDRHSLDYHEARQSYYLWAIHAVL